MRFRPDWSLGGRPVLGQSCPAISAHTEQLVERDIELAAITDLIGRATRGSSGVLLVEGSAGVAKTRLLGRR
jgi:hypothetical protein